ncbi:hypothetical protein O181_005825 [Austropuccinia psidii MF-1]|uniref:CCHC-type domain-containing protein n=1 Tax=Austropuccinia psidii MF-1 TaxID=1389203 RepID=A0A9Q3BJR1_9BASI|nr:hypothetical protein [Austropuccinia psidii MF-1]
MNPQPQGHALYNPYQEDIKPDVLLDNNPRSLSQYQDGDNMTYLEQEVPKQLPEASSWPNVFGVGEYDHMELIDHIYGLLIDVPSIPDYWITDSKRTNIGKYYPYKSSSYKEKQPFRVDIKDKPKESLAEVTKKKNYCHNCGSTYHYAKNCPKAKKNIYAIEQVLEEEYPKEDSESDSMGDAIIEHSDDEQDPKEELVVEYQEETQLQIQDIQLEEGMPQDTAHKNLCKHTQDSQTFLVTPTRVIPYIHGTATKLTV